MQNLHTKYLLTIEVISPVHIGNGNELQRDYDYAVDKGRTWVIDQERLLEATLSPDGSFNNEWLAYPPAQFLKREDFTTDSPYFRYVLPGEPENRPLREHIKDVWGRPYLPGSTLKGMLRTLLMWGMYTADGEKPDLSKLGDNRYWAAQRLENELFAPGARRGEEQNKSVLRALHVSDSTPVEPAAMHVASAHIYPTSSGGRNKGVNVDVEALGKDVVLQAEVAIEEYGFQNKAARQALQWNGFRERLGQLRLFGEAHANRRIREEAGFHGERGPRQAVAFYRGILAGIYRNLADNEWLAQIGWGAGWRSHTLGDLLTGQPGFARVITNYRLGRGSYNPPSQFPKSRKLILVNGEPAIPMGWVKCRLEEV